MEKKNPFYDAIGAIAWGYLLLHLDINLGSINILPEWLGYLLMLSALPVLAQEIPSALLLKPLGEILALWEGVQWVMKLLGREFSPYLIEVIIGVVSLYFHFQLLTNLAELAGRYPPPPEEPHYLPGTEPAQPDKPPAPRQVRLLRLRTARTLLITVLLLPFHRGLAEWTPFAAAMVIANLVVAVRLLFTLFELRRSFPQETAENTGNSSTM